MTASAERTPSEQGTHVRWSYAKPSPTAETEVGEAASDNFGLSDGPQILWFPSLTHARAFCRRVEREIPEVTTELLR